MTWMGRARRGGAGSVDDRSGREQSNARSRVGRAQRTEQARLRGWRWYLKGVAGDVQVALQGPRLCPVRFGDWRRKGGSDQAWRPAAADPLLEPPPLTHQPSHPRPHLRLHCLRHGFHCCSLGPSRGPPPTLRSRPPPMGQLDGPSRSSRGQACPQNWGQARSRTLRMPQAHQQWHKRHGANWTLQVLMVIMSGVFGLAGWHFCTLAQ